MKLEARLWLDDQRTAPDDTWHRVWTAPRAIECLAKRAYVEASFDHDLGACKQCLADHDELDIPLECVHNGNGYQVLCWLEEQIATDPTFPIPTLHVHTGNAGARHKMEQAVKSIERIKQQRTRIVR